MENSIFNVLKKYQDSDGRYPAGFNIYRLIDEDPGPNLDEIAGDRDANALYLMEEDPISDIEAGALLDALVESIINDEEKFDRAISRIFELIRVKSSSNVNPVFLNTIIKNEDKYPPEFFANLALTELMYGDSIEGIKFAMELMSILSVEELEREIPGIKDTIRTYAYYDEFSLHAIMAMTSWENAEAEIFQIYRKARNWGKIHVIQFSDSFSEEESEIIINDLTMLDQQYIEICYEEILNKCSVIEMLKKGVTNLQFHGILKLTETILRNSMKNPQFQMKDKIIYELLDALLEEINRHKSIKRISLADYEIINYIYLNACFSEIIPPSFSDAFRDLVYDPECVRAVNVAAHLGMFEYFSFATNFLFPLAEASAKAIRDNPIYAIKIASMALNYDDIDADMIIDSLVESVDFNFMLSKDGQRQISIYRSEDAIDYMILLSSLDDHPYKGEELLLIALKSKYVELPILAIRTLIFWKTNHQIIWQLLPDIKDQLYRMLDGDVPEIQKDIVRTLLTDENSGSGQDKFTKNVLDYIDKLEDEEETKVRKKRLN